MSEYTLASDFIPTREERNFKLSLKETNRGVASYEIDRTIRIEVTKIGARLVERLTHERIIQPIYNKDRIKVYFLLANGTQTNFNSIPQILRWLVSPIQPALIISSFAHDWATNEFDDDSFEVFVYDGDYYIAKSSSNVGNTAYKKAFYDLQCLIGMQHKHEVLGPTYIKWTESAEIYRGLAGGYKGRTNKVTTFLAFNGLRIGGFFKRILGNTR